VGDDDLGSPGRGLDQLSPEAAAAFRLIIRLLSSIRAAFERPFFCCLPI
jgi:hypothetical protein